MRGGIRTGRGPRLVLAMAAVGAALLVVLLRAHSAPSGPAPPPPVPVDVEIVARRDMPISLEASGVVTSLAVAAVRTRVDGLIVRVAFHEGQEVRRGQLLAVIDPRPFAAELARANATVRRDRALAADLRANQARARQLAALGAGPAQSADTLKAQAEAADATTAADQAIAASARLNLEFTRVTAPIDGRAGLRQIDPGTLVRASDPTPLVSVTQMAPISILFSVPQERLPDLRQAAANGRLPVEAIAEDRIAEIGSLDAIDSTVDPATGQVKLRAVFGNPRRQLWPGQLITARVRLATLHGAVTVSDAAVLNGQAGPYVYVVDAAQHAFARPVETGPSVGGFTVVERGLAPGERVVAHGQSRLRNGASILVQSGAR